MFDFLFGQKAQRITSLFSQSFRLLGEENVRTLLLQRVLFSLTVHGLAIVGLAMVCFHLHAGLGWLLLVLLLAVIYPYSFFYHIRARARQTWFAYAKITNHASPLTEADRIIAAQKWNLRLFAFAELTLRNATGSESNENKGGGIFSFLVGAALMALEGIYEIAESYLLPTLVIEQISLSKAAGKLRELKNHIPQTLLGSFGFDVFGGVISSTLFIIYTGILGGGVALAIGIPHLHLISPDYIFHMTEEKTGNPLDLFIFPLLVSLVVISAVRRLVRIIITSLQAMYFAVFYTRINHADELIPELREEVDAFLQQPATNSVIIS